MQELRPPRLDPDTRRSARELIWVIETIAGSARHGELPGLTHAQALELVADKARALRELLLEGR